MLHTLIYPIYFISNNIKYVYFYFFLIQATSPALCLHRCINARNINCLRESERTCFKNTSKSITPLRNASPI